MNETASRRPTFGSLFSGIGGLDLGFERAGLSCLWQCERNAFAQRILKKHWPHTPLYDDVQRLALPDDPSTLPETPDVIVGGFPCKQTSLVAAVQKRRVGLEGKDSGLWFDMLRVVRLVRPRWVVVENVAGAASYAATIEGGLAEAGYCLCGEPRRLSAQNVGAPHLRRRMFWIAHRDEPGLAVARCDGPPETTGFSRRAADGNAWLSALAGGVRVADGVPGGLDRRERIIAVGNAVVPAVAERVAGELLRLMDAAGGAGVST